VGWTIISSSESVKNTQPCIRFDLRSVRELRPKATPWVLAKKWRRKPRHAADLSGSALVRETEHLFESTDVPVDRAFSISCRWHAITSRLTISVPTAVAYNYAWKTGISIFFKHSLGFHQPLVSALMLVDLLNGEAYCVHSVLKDGDDGRSIVNMPEDVVHTFPAMKLSGDELDAVRRKHKSEPYGHPGPHQGFAIRDSILG
jgi:hypothetical protein